VSRLEHLDERYHAYHRQRERIGFVFGGDERATLVRRLVGGPGLRVLDLGCRDGAMTRAYAEENEVVGVDVDRGALAEAATRGIGTVWADVEEPWPFPEASFDVVVAGELIEHLRDPERLVVRARRVLRPGGTFVGSVPNFFRLRNRLAMLFGRPLDHDPTHLQIFAPRDVERLMAGWKDLQLHFISSRFLRLSPRLFGNILVFTASTPR
jgi:SAM-dependent methyltransferase